MARKALNQAVLDQVAPETNRHEADLAFAALSDHVNKQLRASNERRAARRAEDATGARQAQGATGTIASGAFGWLLTGSVCVCRPR